MILLLCHVGKQFNLAFFNISPFSFSVEAGNMSVVASRFHKKRNYTINIPLDFNF